MGAAPEADLCTENCPAYSGEDNTTPRISLCTDMNQRTAKVVQMNESLAVVLPKDWTRGMRVAKGDKVDLFYNGFIRIKARRPDTSRSESTNAPAGSGSA